jgi:hypothetical protein
LADFCGICTPFYGNRESLGTFAVATSSSESSSVTSNQQIRKDDRNLSRSCGPDRIKQSGLFLSHRWTQEVPRADAVAPIAADGITRPSTYHHVSPCTPKFHPEVLFKYAGVALYLMGKSYLKRPYSGFPGLIDNRVRRDYGRHCKLVIPNPRRPDRPT